MVFDCTLLVILNITIFVWKHLNQSYITGPGKKYPTAGNTRARSF